MDARDVPRLSFAKRTALANAGANLRSQSQRANVSPGQLRSARNNIGIYGIDTDSLFGNINAAQNSLVGQGTLAQLGVSGGDLQKSPGDLLPTLLPKMVQMLKQFGGTSEAFNALGFGNITDFQTLQQLGRLNPKEFSGMMSNYQNDVSKLNVDDKTLMESQRLATSFHDAADAIENVFMKGIIKYAPQIEEMSKKIVDGFGALLNFLNASTPEKFKKLGFAPPPDPNRPEVQQGTSGVPWLDRLLGKNNSWLHPGSASVGAPFTPNAMLNAIYGIESSYGTDPRAQNRNATYQGLFQVGKDVRNKYGITDPWDYANASHGASLFLDDLTRKYHGDQHKIVAAYNQGETTIDRLIKAHPKDWEKFAPKQAQDYITKYDRLNASNRQTLNSYAGGNPSLSSGGVNINIFNNTGGNAIVTASQLAVPQ